VEEAISVFLKMYQPKLMCVTCGKYGSTAIYKDIQVDCEAVLRADTIETTGAGDTFMGCVLNYVLENGMENLSAENLYQMQKFAAMAASIITTRKGALKVMPTKKEIMHNL